MTDVSTNQPAESHEPLLNMADNQAPKIATDETFTHFVIDSSSPYKPTPLPTKYVRQETSRILHGYLVAVILANFCLLFLKGYTQDLGYWEDWVRQLSTTGYENFNGNYPPFYIHWLFLVGKVYNTVGIPLEANFFLKFLTQLPVTVSHCLLTTLIYSLLKRFDAPRSFLHIIMMLTVFNPTILVNGPIWGQVDLIPITLVTCSILLSFHQRFAYFAIPMFVLALLTKFQMIAFAPVFGFMFFRNINKNLIGIIISVAIGALVFMPSILAGHFLQAFRLAYIDTLGQYPVTTFNAANLWILLTSNTAPDSQLLFGTTESSTFAKIFTAKYFGMLLFSLTAILVFLQGVYRHIDTIKRANLMPTNTNARSNSIDSTQTLLSQIFFSAMLCAIAFFTLLPAMHERYLFPAAVLALAYSATAQKKLVYPLAISLVCSLNMLIILEINGSDIWLGLAWAMVAILGLCLMETIFGEGLYSKLKSVGLFFYRIPKVSIFVFIAATLIMMYSFLNHLKIHKVTLAKNQIFLTDLPQVYAQQDHGSLKLHRSYDGNILSVGNKRYSQGLGTHSNSNIQYQLPEDATQFSFIAGLDDEVGIADVQFSVWDGDKLLWESTIMYGYERSAQTHTIDVRNVKVLKLSVAALKDDKWDHANWVNTIVTREHKKP